MTRVAETLQDYLDQVLPATYRRGYHLRLAKGGPDYPHLPEQSLLVHVLNGVFGLVRLLSWLEEARISLTGLDEAMLRRVLALYTIHDVHKLGDFERLGVSEFSVPLTRLAEEWEALGLDSFAGPVDEHLLRAANVSRRSRHQGDLLLAGAGAGRDWLLVRIADAMASSIHPREAASSLGGYLKALAPEVATGWRLYWHELRDVRGVLTNLIHVAVAEEVRPLGFYPLLFFPTGTLYVGPKEQRERDRSAFLDLLAERVLRHVVPPEHLQKSAAAEGLRREKYDFQPYVYAFARAEVLLDIVLEETQRTKPDAKVVHEDVGKIGAKKSAPRGWAGSFEDRFRVSLGESKGFNERWCLVRRYLLYLDAIFKTLAPTLDRIGWYEGTFDLPADVSSALREDLQLFESGGVSKHVIVPAYHFLKGSAFAARPAEATDVPEVLQRLHERVLARLPHRELEAGRKAVVDQLGFGPDLREYLGEHLVLSWAPDALPARDPMQHYAVPKRKGHSERLCSLCNRTSEHVQPLRTGVLGDFGQVFSNRVLPARIAPQDPRPWCPVCHLEFMLRRLAGLSLPAGADYRTSYRIYLYVLPTYSFTPEHAALLGRLLRPLQQVTSLPVRDHGEASPGIPRLWLERRVLDPDWIDTVLQVFEREAARIARGGPFGDRLLTTGVFTQPNYLLVPWERSVRQGEQDDARIPTRTEAWAKATFAAAVIAALTGSRVYVTERPFLPLSDPDALRSTVTLDSPPPAVAKLLGNEQDPKLRPQTESISLFGREAGSRSGLERALDLYAALWQVTCDVRRATGEPTKDRHVAERLGALITQPLAGARFYKEYARLNDGASPLPPLVRACEVLLDYLGGETMDLVSRIAEKTLEIRLPYREIGRGKAHSYELVFREAIGAITEEFVKIPELRRLALSGAEPPAESLVELKWRAAGRVYKAMERRRDQRFRGVILPWGGDLNAKVWELIELIVNEVFLRQAGGSFSRFSQLENGLADGVYYYVDRVLSQKWEEYNRLKAERKALAEVGAVIQLQGVGEG